MTQDRKPNHEALDRIADAMMEDVLSASDQEILAEVAEDGDLSTLERRMQALLSKTINELNSTPAAPQSNTATNSQLINDEANVVVGEFRGKVAQRSAPSIGAPLRAAEHPTSTRRERAAASGRGRLVENTQEPIRPYDRVWIDGAECAVLHSVIDERIYVEGALPIAAMSVVLGGKCWPLKKVAAPGNVARFEIIGMTLGIMDDLCEIHAGPNRSGRMQ